MADNLVAPEEEPLLASAWDPEDGNRCIVCKRPSGGKAVCSEPACAAELASG